MYPYIGKRSVYAYYAGVTVPTQTRVVNMRLCPRVICREVAAGIPHTT